MSALLDRTTTQEVKHVDEDRLRKALATTTRNAEGLFTEQGYELEEDAVFDGSYTVISPFGKRYFVTVDGTSKDCTCQAFKHLGSCKHVLAVEEYRTAREAAQVAALEEWYERRYYTHTF